MPELPEVETARRLAHRELVGRRIEQVRAAPDPLIFDRASPAEVEGALTGREVSSTGRKGKYFWLILDQPPHPVFHFGMSGRLTIGARNAGKPDRPPARPSAVGLAAAPSVGGNEHPTPEVPYTKLRIEVSGGGIATFTDPRRLGRIRLAVEPEKEPPVSRLGFDVLNSLPRLPDLAHRLALRRGPIKAVLLDQGFSAGVGNWLADEVLYQARLSPLRAANELTTGEIRRLHRALKSVTEKAVEVDADSDRFPSDWLFHRRWDHRIGTSARGESLVRQQVGGRTTTWAPGRQK